MKKFFSFLFFLFCGLWFSQVSVSVKGHLGQPADNVNVQLQKNGKTLDFKKTDKNGNCSFAVSENGVYTLKLTSMFYKSEELQIDTSEKKHVEISLQSQITEIKEVEIKARPKIAKAKEDTIAFNIKEIKDGTERTAEDVIKKIPGLSIADNGKVSFKGKNIGQVLVEGNEFFGANHKMATQNISADMLEGIDLWQNYTTINGNTSSALNLKLKDKYKGRITGSLEAGFGSGKNYLGHSNLFKFNKIGNLALISDFNNIAKDPVSFMDFYEMNTQKQIDNDSETKITMEIPSFLNNDGKVKQKDNQFSALQYSKGSKKWSITVYSIFNFAQIKKENLTQRTAFEGQPSGYNFYEKETENNKGFFGTTQIKAKYKLTDKTFFYYNFGYNPMNDNFSRNTERTYFSTENNIGIAEHSKQFSLDNYLSFNTNFDAKTKLVFDLSQSKNSLKQDLDFASNLVLFGLNQTDLKQKYNLASDKYSANIYLKNQNKILDFNLQSGITLAKNEAVSEEKTGGNSNFQNLETYNYLNAVNLSKKIGNWNFSASLDWHYLSINDEKSQNYFEKDFRIKYRPQTISSQEYGFEYRENYENPNLKLLQNFPLYSKEMTYSENGNLLAGNLSKYHSFKWNYHHFSFEKGNIWFVILSYDFTKDFFSTDTKNYGFYSVLQNVSAGEKDRFFAVISNETRIKPYLILKTKIVGMKNRTDNFISGKSNVSQIENLEINQQFSTNFKKFPVQFDAGYVFNKNNFLQKLYGAESSQQNLRILFGVRTIIRKTLIMNVLSEYLIQKTSSQSKKDFLLGGQFSYRKENSKWEFNARFNNVLNLKNFNYITGKTTENGTEYSEISALKGYVIGGIKVYF
ncbi:MAG: hypothetical protein QM564_02095 [Bergeyella sp.]